MIASGKPRATCRAVLMIAPSKLRATSDRAPGTGPCNQASAASLFNRGVSFLAIPEPRAKLS